MVEDGLDPPSEFYSQPEIWIEADWHWKAFSDLSSDRAIGMGLGPIPVTAMLRYAEFCGLDDVDAIERFRLIVSSVDAEYLTLNTPKGQRDDKMRSLVPITDAEGISAILGRLGK